MQYFHLKLKRTQTALQNGSQSLVKDNDDDIREKDVFRVLDIKAISEASWRAALVV